MKYFNTTLSLSSIVLFFSSSSSFTNCNVFLRFMSFCPSVLLLREQERENVRKRIQTLQELGAEVCAQKRVLSCMLQSSLSPSHFLLYEDILTFSNGPSAHSLTHPHFLSPSLSLFLTLLTSVILSLLYPSQNSSNEWPRNGGKVHYFCRNKNRKK